MLATRSIARGELVLAETPILIVNSYLDEAGLATAVEALDERGRSAFLALSNAHPEEPLAGIVKSNALPHGSGEASSGGIYEIGCRLNHSCRPSTNHHFDDGRGVEVFQATRAVAAEEELTDYYTFLLKSSEERKADLRERFGFECACEVCSLPPVELAASDKRRAAINATLASIPSLISSPLRIIMKVRQALKDLEREGLVLVQPALAFDAYQVALLYGDVASAREWAKLMVKFHEVADGVDSTKCAEAREVVEADPRKDPRFGKYGRKSVGGP